MKTKKYSLLFFIFFQKPAKQFLPLSLEIIFLANLLLFAFNLFDYNQIQTRWKLYFVFGLNYADILLMAELGIQLIIVLVMTFHLRNLRKKSNKSAKSIGIFFLIATALIILVNLALFIDYLDFIFHFNKTKYSHFILTLVCPLILHCVYLAVLAWLWYLAFLIFKVSSHLERFPQDIDDPYTINPDSNSQQDFTTQNTDENYFAENNQELTMKVDYSK